MVLIRISATELDRLRRHLLRTPRCEQGAFLFCRHSVSPGGDHVFECEDWSPKRLLTYRGDRGIVTTGNPDAKPGCYFCKTIAGAGAGAAVERYIIDTAESLAV